MPRPPRDTFQSRNLKLVNYFPIVLPAADVCSPKRVPERFAIRARQSRYPRSIKPRVAISYLENILGYACLPPRNRTAPRMLTQSNTRIFLMLNRCLPVIAIFHSVLSFSLTRNVFTEPSRVLRATSMGTRYFSAVSPVYSCHFKSEPLIAQYGFTRGNKREIQTTVRNGTSLFTDGLNLGNRDAKLSWK